MEMRKMAIKDLIPWSRGGNVSVRRDDEAHPFVTFHREMNRLFDDAFRGFGMQPFGANRFFEGAQLWPRIEVDEDDREVKVTAELPGLEEKDIEVEVANGVLRIMGERKTETTDRDRDRVFSERHYGRFERRIPVDDIEEDRVNASFKNGLLTVTMPKSARARERVKRVQINGK
jgi:HSP20 family protein